MVACVWVFLIFFLVIGEIVMKELVYYFGGSLLKTVTIGLTLFIPKSSISGMQEIEIHVYTYNTYYSAVLILQSP